MKEASLIWSRVTLLLMVALVGCRSGLQGRAVPAPAATRSADDEMEEDEEEDEAMGVSYFLTAPSFSIVRRAGEDKDSTYAIEVSAVPDPERRFEVGMTHGWFTSDTFELKLTPAGVVSELNSKRKDEIGPTLIGVLKVAASAAGVAAKAIKPLLTEGEQQVILSTTAAVNSTQREQLRLVIDMRRGLGGAVEAVKLSALTTPDPTAEMLYVLVEAGKLKSAWAPGFEPGEIDIKPGDLVLARKLVAYKNAHYWVLVRRQAFPPATAAAVDAASPAPLPGDRYLLTTAGQLGGVDFTEGSLVEFRDNAWKAAKEVTVAPSQEELAIARGNMALIREKVEEQTPTELAKLEAVEAEVRKAPGTNASADPVRAAEEHLELLGHARSLEALLTPTPRQVMAASLKAFETALALALAAPDDPKARVGLERKTTEVRRLIDLVVRADESLHGRGLKDRRDKLLKFLGKTDIPGDKEVFESYAAFAAELRAVLGEIDKSLPSTTKAASTYIQATDTTSRISGDRVLVHRLALRPSKANADLLERAARIRLAADLVDAVVIVSPEVK